MNKESKSLRILNLIASVDGMRFTDIQRALWEMTHSEPFTPKQRGYWCVGLTGCRLNSFIVPARYSVGLLSFYCEKGPDGLWRSKRPHSRMPWTFA